LIFDCTHDVLSEADNDENGDYCEVATQEDMDNW
jgi:hypothetical protein